MPGRKICQGRDEIMGEQNQELRDGRTASKRIQRADAIGSEMSEMEPDEGTLKWNGAKVSLGLNG